MAVPTTTGLYPANNTLIITEYTTSGVVPQSGAAIGIVVVGTPTKTFSVGQIIMYRNTGAIQFTQGSHNFQVISVDNYLLTIVLSS